MPHQSQAGRGRSAITADNMFSNTLFRGLLGVLDIKSQHVAAESVLHTSQEVRGGAEAETRCEGGGVGPDADT